MACTGRPRHMKGASCQGSARGDRRGPASYVRRGLSYARQRERLRLSCDTSLRRGSDGPAAGLPAPVSPGSWLSGRLTGWLGAAGAIGLQPPVEPACAGACTELAPMRPEERAELRSALRAGDDNPRTALPAMASARRKPMRQHPQVTAATRRQAVLRWLCWGHVQPPALCVRAFGLCRARRASRGRLWLPGLWTDGGRARACTAGPSCRDPCRRGGPSVGRASRRCGTAVHRRPRRGRRTGRARLALRLGSGHRCCRQGPRD